MQLGLISVVGLCIGTSVLVGGVMKAKRGTWTRAASMDMLQTFQDRMLPVVLRIAFLIYPIVTNVAFEAWPCYKFQNGRGWLVADVNIECWQKEHYNVRALAMAGVMIYPVGLFALNAALLFKARKAITQSKPTHLSRALSFLHREYEPNFFWWELMECVPSAASNIHAHH